MLKRAIDIIAGSVALILLLPVMVVLAIGLAVSLRCWPFFTQRRIGQGGKPFVLLKLRTLPRKTPPYITKQHLQVAIPRFAGFVRRRRLDELPQLLHVVSGHMSLVGPRPRMPDEFEPVDAAYSRTRETVPQGCTGLWQVSDDIGVLPSEAPEYDLLYVRHRSTKIDVVVLWRTALIMLGVAERMSLQQIRNLVESDADGEPVRGLPPTSAAIAEPSSQRS
ncbi:MAG: sugar transferase [Acidimicrobiales bacterium]